MKKAKKHLNKEREPEKSFFPTAKEILEQAFKHTSRISVNRKGKTPLKVVRELNAEKIKFFGEFLQKKISDLSKQFPKIESMDPFYLDLLGTIANTPRLKTNLAKLNSSARIIKKLRFEYYRDAFTAISIPAANKALFTFQGRVSSVVKKLESVLKELKEDSKRLDEMPSIDFEAKTVVLAGYPNTGKTTLLKRITGSEAKISNYPFTTRQINSGFFEAKYEKIQVLDTPGILDREELSDIELKAVAVIKHLAHLIVFIVDPTMGCGFDLEDQIGLLKKTKKRFSGKRIIVIVNKEDVATKEEMDTALSALKSFGEIIVTGENSWGKLKEEIGKALFENG